MDFKSYSISVPGSLMLFGEHAVLHDKMAIVAAIDKYVHIDLVPRCDRNIKIVSAKFSEHLVSLDNFIITKPYDYALTAIEQYLTEIYCGFTLNIRADFPEVIGFGSSAAVTVATLGVVALWIKRKPLDLLQLYKQAVTVTRLVQGGVGSGADVAASIFGGVIAYKMHPVKIEKVKSAIPLVVIYSGNKISTPVVVAKVEMVCKRFPDLFTCLYDAIDCCVKDAIDAIKNNDLSALGKLMNIHQGLQDSLGVNNIVLAELIFALRAVPKSGEYIYGAKISGAGLGDCIIGLGNIASHTFPQNDFQKKNGIKQIDIAISQIGLEHR